LKFRKSFSEALYINSNGFVRLTQALVVGDRTYIPSEINDKFIITGLIHLLAISGLHVAMITTLFFFLLFFIPKKIRYLLISLLLLFYMPFAAFNVPVNRASLCAIIIMVLFLLEIKVDYRKFLLFIATFFIILNPHVIRDLSFIMSFLAVAGIIYLGFNSKSKILNGFYIGFAAQTAIIPVTLYTFGMTNISSVLTTVLILPIININIFIGLLSTIYPSAFTPILIYIEKAILYMINYFYLYTYNTFFLYKINTVIFLCMLSILIIVFYKTNLKFLIFTIYIFLLIPVYNMCGVYILKENNNLFIISINNNKELYFKGDYNFYKYKLLPQLAKMRLKVFDNGKILLKNEQNNYIRFKNTSEQENVCIKKRTNNCNVLYKKDYLLLQKDFIKKHYQISSNILNFIPFNE
jgi:competence protein ComEC